MAVSDYSTTPGNNTSIAGTNIAEGCSPSNINNALRQMMADMKAFSVDLDWFSLSGDILSISARLKSTVSDRTGYATDTSAYAIDLSNGDLVGVNALYFNDIAGGPTEGILFPRASGAGFEGYSSIWVDENSILQFAPDASGTSHVIPHRGIITSPAYAALLGEDAPALANADTITNTGTYSITEATVGAPTAASSYDGTLVHRAANGQSDQDVIIAGTVRYWRVKDSTTWSDWQRIPLLSDITTGLDWPYDQVLTLPSGAGGREFTLSGVDTSEYAHVEAFFEATANVDAQYTTGTRIPMTSGGVDSDYTLSITPTVVRYVQINRPEIRQYSDGGEITMSNTQWQIRVRARDYA